MLQLIGCRELLAQANEAHRRARSRPATIRDAYLVTRRSEVDLATHPNEVGELSRSAMRKVQAFLSSRGAPQHCSKERPHEAEARRVRSVQSSSCMTSFETDGLRATDYLPGGVPLIDHFAARLGHLPDWHCLLPGVAKLCSSRLPDPEKPASQREFTLGVTPEHHVLATLEFLKDHMKLTRKTFTTCILAADTESIGIVKADYDQVMSGKPGQSHSLRVAKKGESADPLPVRFMVGHVGWQVDVLIPTVSTTNASGRRFLKIEPGALQPSALPFFQKLGTMIGVDIVDDYNSFFTLVRNIFGADLWEHIDTPREMEHIARLAGYNIKRYSLDTLNWICFGTVLAKGEVSIGDQRWDSPWDSLPVPLRGYLAGDIAQAAAAAHLFQCLWVVNTFPDPHAAHMISPMSAPELMVWWTSRMLEAFHTLYPISDWDTRESIGEVWNDIFHTDKDGRVICPLIPVWSSATTGGPRFVHDVRAHLLKICGVLQEMDPDVWPQMPPETKRLVVFDRTHVEGTPLSTDPVKVLGWCLTPSVPASSAISVPADQISFKDIARLRQGGVGMKALLLEASRINPRWGLELLARLESHPRAPKAVLGCTWKANKMIPIIREFLTVCDLLPDRPAGWQDPFREEQAKAKKVERITAKAEEMAQHAKRKARRATERYSQLKHAAKAVKRKAPERVDRTWELLRLVTPAGGAPKKRCIEPAHDATEPMTLLRQSLQVTVGIGGPSVSAEKREVSSAGPVDGHLAGRHGVVPMEPRCSEQSTLELPSTIYLVGNDHAVQANLGIPGSSIQVPTITIPIREWTKSTIKTAAAQLEQADLHDALVILWLHDEQAFIVQGSGDPLERSTYDGRYHCDGLLGVMGSMGMAPLLEETRPLFEACRSAKKLVLMTPLPRYLTAPCCESDGHCLCFYTERARREICRGVADLREAAIRWVSWCRQENLYVVAPHLELMEVAKSLREDGMTFLQDSYYYDGVQLTADGYRDILSRVAVVLQSEPWRYRPPMEDMPEPHRVRATTARRPLPDRSGRRAIGYYDRDMEVLADRLSVEDRKAGFRIEDKRAAERGPWRADDLQDRGPIIDADVWAQARTAAAASGYPPTSRPAGGRPG